MLRLSILLLIVALLTALFGFTGIAVAVTGIAKILFLVFLAVLLVSLLMGFTVLRT